MIVVERSDIETIAKIESLGTWEYERNIADKHQSRARSRHRPRESARERSLLPALQTDKPIQNFIPRKNAYTA